MDESPKDCKNCQHYRTKNPLPLGMGSVKWIRNVGNHDCILWYGDLIGKYPTKEMAIKQWNKRVGDK